MVKKNSFLDTVIEVDHKKKKKKTKKKKKKSKEKKNFFFFPKRSRSNKVQHSINHS